MPNERVQRRIDLLLDEVEAAIDVRDWKRVQARCSSVLVLDPGNLDAKACLAIYPRTDPARR